MNCSHRNCATRSTHLSSAEISNFVSGKIRTFANWFATWLKAWEWEVEAGRPAPKPCARGTPDEGVRGYTSFALTVLCLYEFLYVRRLHWEPPHDFSSGVVKGRRDRGCGESIGCL